MMEANGKQVAKAGAKLKDRRAEGFSALSERYLKAGCQPMLERDEGRY